jgi:hypothetical protein
MPVAMITLVWQRIRRADMLLAALVARLREGAPVVVRERRQGAAVASSVVPREGSALPRRFGWLLPLVPGEAANLASQLCCVLAEPDMVALLAATPQARRILGPLCRMLGIEVAMLRPVVAGRAAPVATMCPVRQLVPVAAEAALEADGVQGASLHLLGWRRFVPG